MPELTLAAQLCNRLSRCTAQLVPRLAGAAQSLNAMEAWKPLRFAHVNDFARECLDHSGSWLRQLARLGRTCQEMPALTHAITGADGGKPLGRAAAYEICRVARVDTVDEWIQRARQCTIRQLKESIRRAQETGPAPVSATPPGRASAALQVPVPPFLVGALLDIERVFRATNPGSRRCDLLEALTAEYASGVDSGMIDAGMVDSSRNVRASGAAATSRKHSEPNFLDTEIAPDKLADNTNNRELLQARWTLQRVHLFVESLEEEAQETRSSSGDATATSPKQFVRSIREILALEHEVKLRIDRLLLWLDHRRAWTHLGYADAAEFGQKVLDESASTTRNRLRLARALEHSDTLSRGAESGQVSHQRLVRLAQLMKRRKLDEASLGPWVDHVPQIRIKRLDEEFDALERRRWSAGAASAGAALAGGVDTEPVAVDPVAAPLPLTDAAWQASLRLVPGEARQRLLMGALQALASETPANVCHRFAGPAAIIRDLRHGLNVARVRLAEQGSDLVHSRQQDRDSLSPADEARLFPSIRLAARHIEHGTPIPDWICLLSLLEEFVEEYDNPRNMPRRPTDVIAARDGWRCTAPGCTSREIEIHHIVYRSHGGSDDPSNLTSVCPFHHRMGEHDGLLKLTGTAPLALRWQIGDRVFVNERAV